MTQLTRDKPIKRTLVDLDSVLLALTIIMLPDHDYLFDQVETAILALPAHAQCIGSTLARGDQIESDFYELKSQELGPKMDKAEIIARINAALFWPDDSQEASRAADLNDPRPIWDQRD